MKNTTIRVIAPKGLFIDPKRYQRAADNTLQGAAEGAKVDFETTTQTWRRKPPFTITKTKDSRIVSTGDEIYGYVEKGTRPHIIAPKNKKALFRGTKGSYTAKTSPGTIGSGPGRQGAKIISSRPVHHPGTKPRRFAPVIAAKWRKQMQKIYDRALKAEGFR